MLAAKFFFNIEINKDMEFKVHGPFDVPRVGNLIARRIPDQRVLWDQVEEVAPGLSSAIGCYLFALRGVVWYVGMAGRQSFMRECLTVHKQALFNEALQKVPNAKPKLFLLPKISSGGVFRTPSAQNHPVIESVESVLIGMAIKRNPDLLNIRGTKLLRDVNVPGVINNRQGQATANSVKALRKALGL